MARTVTLVWSGEDISLIDTSGFMAKRGGFGRSTFKTRMDLVESVVGAANQLRSTRVPTIVERYRLNLLSTTHDLAAADMQGLHQALLEAEKYHTTDWQISPVYLKVQTTDESNARYALVYGSSQLSTPDFFDQPFESNNEIESVEVHITREPYWRSAAPSTLPTEITLTGVQEPGVDGVEQFVQLAFNQQVLSHIFIDNGGAFGSNQVAATDYDLLPAVPAVDDALYCGDTDNPFFTLLFDLSTLSSGVTGVWEIWNGGGWSASVETRDGADGTDDLSGFSGQTGQYAVYAGNVDDWATTSVNSVTAYWMRFRVTAVDSPTPPHQSSAQTVGMGMRNYIEIPAAAIDGDVDALARFWFSRKVDNTVSASANAYGEIICGIKSRNIGGETNTSYLPVGLTSSGLPTGWTGAANTDTAAFTNRNFPKSTIARCTFSGTAGATTRWTLTCADAQAENWQGSYQVYFLGYQTLGSAEDVELELAWNVSGLQPIFNGFVPMRRVETDADDEMVEVVNLGRIDIPPIEKTRGLVPDGSASLTQIKLQLRALSNNGSTPNLHLAALVLIPIDEMSFRITRPDVAQGSDVYAMTPDRAVVLDGGLVGEGAELLSHGNTDFDVHVMQWMLRSDAPKLPPDKKIRLYFLPIDSRDPANPGVVVSSHSGFFVRVWTHERWHSLRGAD